MQLELIKSVFLCDGLRYNLLLLLLGTHPISFNTVLLLFFIYIFLSQFEFAGNNDTLIAMSLNNIMRCAHFKKIWSNL